jgi:hypothetical protein
MSPRPSSRTPSSCPGCRASRTSGSFGSGAYVYDGAGNITGIGSDSFTYDARSRLKTATLSGQPQRTFSYDGFNNLTQNGSLTIGIAPATNRITSGSALYDLRGNLTAYNGESMTFDAFNRLVNKGSTAGNWTYLYDSGGERLAAGTGSVLRYGIEGDRRAVAKMGSVLHCGGIVWRWRGRHELSSRERCIT